MTTEPITVAETLAEKWQREAEEKQAERMERVVDGSYKVTHQGAPEGFDPDSVPVVERRGES